MKRSLTKTHFVALGVVLVLAIGYAAGALYLNSAAFRHKLLQRLNAAMDGRLTLQDHYLALHALQLELRGVKLNDAQGQPLASMEGLRMRLFWPALLRRTLHIKSLALDNVRFHLRFDLSDRLQLVTPRAPSGPPDNDSNETSRWALRIDDFRLNQGTIRFERPAKGWSGQMDVPEITAQMDSNRPAGQIQISAAPLEWEQTETAYSLPALKLSAAMDDARTITVSVQTPKSTLKATGRIDRTAAAPQMDLSCDLEMDPEEFQAWLPKATGLKGLISASIVSKGVLDDPTVAVKATWNGAQAMGVAIETLEADLRMHQRTVTLNALGSHGSWGNMDMTGFIDLQPVFGDRLNFAAAQWEKITYQLKLNGENIKPDRLGVLTFPAGGTWQVQADMTGSGLADPGALGKAHIDLQASGLTPPHGAPDVDVDGHLATDIQRKGLTLELSRFQAAVDDNTLEAGARINLSTHHIEQAAARLQWTRLETLGALLGIQLPSGNGIMNLKCQGPFRRPTADLEILVQEMAMGDHPLGRLLASARLNKKGQLDVTRMVLENQGALVEGSGRLSLFNPDGGVQPDPGVDLDLVFQRIAPSDFGWPESAGSSFNGRIHLEGSLQHLTGRAMLDESAVQWGGFAGRVTTQALWEDGRLTISDLNLFKAASSIHLKGEAAWRRNDGGGWWAEPRVQAKIEGRDVRLQDFFPDYAGTMTLTGEVKGPSSDLNGVFHLSGTRLEMGGQPLPHLDIKGRLSGEKLHWDTMEITVGKGQQLTSKGWYAFDRRFELTMEAADIGLAHVAALQRAYPVEGLLSLHLNAAGTLDDPQLDADLIIRDPRLNRRQWDDFHLTARMLDRRLKLDADLNFNLTADYQLDSGDFDLQAHFDRSDLAPYLALWGDADWAGVLSGHLQAKGNRYQPEQIQGTLTLDNAELHHQNRLILAVARLNARLENGRLEIPASRLELLQNGFVNLSATGRVPTDLRITSDGRLPVAALAPFTDALEGAQGELAFQAHAQGALDAMQWQAKLSLSEAGFEIPGLIQQVEGLTGRLELTPGRLVVEGLSGNLAGGRFKLDGQLQLSAWKPTGGQLALNAQALPLQWPDTMDVVVNGDLLYKGAAETPSLSGWLVLLEGSYYKDVKLNLLSSVTQARRAVPVPSTYSVPESIAGTALNVGVTHRYPLLVDNNLANLQIAPDLKISGTLARPILSGRAEVVEGQVIFRRKSFEVKRGVVDFINPYKIEPNLDIAAAADIREWQVSLSLSGTPDQLVFKLSSNPPASENDILSLILLGRTGTELAKREGGGGQSTRQMLATLVATAWGEDVKKRSGVDILEVETGGDGDQQSADRVQVTVGKKLSRRLTLKYEVESGSEELVQRAVSEYRFLEHLLASGFQDSTGGYGGELVFRIEF